MKTFFFILITLLFARGVPAQDDSKPDFSWSNTSYFNLRVGDSIRYKGQSVELLKVENHYNRLRVAGDTLWLKVSRRSLPVGVGNVQLFVADNIRVKELSNEHHEHDLLRKDALIGLAEIGNSLAEPNQFIFPVSFNQGFVWRGEEDNYMFSYRQESDPESGGIAIDLNGGGGVKGNWLLAIENSRVVWTVNYPDRESACVLLESESDSGIYYLYDLLSEESLEVKKGQQLKRGDPLGTARGEGPWVHTQIAVLHSDTVPAFDKRYASQVNFFPQLYELNYRHTYSISKSFTRGRIEFGAPAGAKGADRNLSEHEEYLGKGWVFGRWNTADRVESITKGMAGNARLRRILFAGTAAQAANPEDYFDYEINVKNGVYRVRANVGDSEKESWQRVVFEGVAAGEFELGPGEQKWTSEKAVRVEDRKLSVRIFVDPKNKKVTGLSEIVFQRVY